MSAEELAKATQNPVADLISIPFQNNINFGVGPKDNAQNILTLFDYGDHYGRVYAVYEWVDGLPLGLGRIWQSRPR